MEVKQHAQFRALPIPQIPDPQNWFFLFQVLEIIIYDGYDMHFTDDIAILNLKEKAQLSPRVQLVCLPSQSNLKEGLEGMVRYEINYEDITVMWSIHKMSLSLNGR